MIDMIVVVWMQNSGGQTAEGRELYYLKGASWVEQVGQSHMAAENIGECSR